MFTIIIFIIRYSALPALAKNAVPIKMYVDIQKNSQLEKIFLCGVGVAVSATPVNSPPLPSIFSDYSFLVHNSFTLDDRHLLARAMASDFSVAMQFSQRDQKTR
jgi:hypothetical protein